ncbi:MAG: hypothetical protein KGJ02_05810, partial [Verrucomicrobiota bacterium]|nr:hypothetical protein [Verrucomicrobiota bacterium]
NTLWISFTFMGNIPCVVVGVAATVFWNREMVRITEESRAARRARNITNILPAERQMPLLPEALLPKNIQTLFEGG